MGHCAKYFFYSPETHEIQKLHIGRSTPRFPNRIAVFLWKRGNLFGAWIVMAAGDRRYVCARQLAVTYRNNDILLLCKTQETTSL